MLLRFRQVGLSELDFEPGDLPIVAVVAQQADGLDDVATEFGGGMFLGRRLMMRLRASSSSKVSSSDGTPRQVWPVCIDTRAARMRLTAGC